MLQQTFATFAIILRLSLYDIMCNLLGVDELNVAQCVHVLLLVNVADMTTFALHFTCFNTLCNTCTTTKRRPV